jgi:hypothetical protein
MSAVNPQNAKSQIGTLLIRALWEECTNLVFTRGLSRAEEDVLTACNRELAAVGRLLLADARRRIAEGQAESRGFSISISTGFCRFHQESAIGAYISGNHLIHLTGTSGQKYISLLLPFAPYTGERGGQLNKIAL